MKRLSQHGDTLVEVLLAIAVLSSVIGICYNIASRAQRTAQATQERSEAVNLAQTQLDRLRAIRDSGAFSSDNFPNYFSAYFASGSAFCIPAVIPNPLPANPADVLKDAASGTTCNLGTVNRYKVKILFTPDTRLFQVNVDWDASYGSPPYHLDMEYRLW